MAKHKQVRLMSSDRQMFAFVDEGLRDIVLLLWELGVRTSFSCQSDMFEKAYILMPFRSARRLEKIVYAGIRRGDLSAEALDVFRRFSAGQYLFEASLFRIRKQGGKRKIRTLWVRRRRINWGRPYSVERTINNAFGFRTTYRWPAEDTPALLKALIEASQKKHGL